MTYFAENRRDLRCDGEVFLLNEMRRLVLHVSGNVLFGDKGLELARYIQVYFEQRRHLSDGGQAALASRRELVRTGIQIDRKLRARLAQLRSEVRISEVWDPCLLALLSEANIQNTSDLTDDELIAHGNVLFMSSSEPIAVSLTWTLLLLSQRDDLRRAIRKELSDAFPGGKIPDFFPEKELPLLCSVIQETLRVLPPNAIMVRLTKVSAKILGYELPPCCEVIVSPYVAHRDVNEYSEPDKFNPLRWSDMRPSAYTYFPFGVGSRHCLGKQLASFELISLLARILNMYDVVMIDDQEIDWTMDITLMPKSDVAVKFVENREHWPSKGGRLHGPVADLVQI